MSVDNRYNGWGYDPPYPPFPSLADDNAMLVEDNQKLREQLSAAEAALERAKLEDSGYFLALCDAWRAAKTNEECAHLLRLYCTDGKAFWAKYGPRHLETN